MKKPNLFIVGAPKCGTTSLYYYLEKHPSVFFSSHKELNYFSSQELLKQNLYYKSFVVKSEHEYLQQFRNAKKSHFVIGEASVSYLFYPNIAKRIKSFCPESKIIIILRDPVQRAWSHYLMDKRLGFVKKEFSEIFYSIDEKDKLHFQQYFLLGRYYKQVKRYLDVFEKNNVKIIFTRQLRESPKDTIYDVFAFLSVNRLDVDLSVQHNKYKTSRSKLINIMYRNNYIRKSIANLATIRSKEIVSRMLFNEKAPCLQEDFELKLRQYFRDDIIKLESLLVEDFSKWK